VSLHQHISNTYTFDMFSRAFVHVLAAQQTNEAENWYQGTADAVRQNLRYFDLEWCNNVLILSGDQIYRMNYNEMLITHENSDADVTLAVLPVPRSQAEGLGLVRVNDSGQIVGFVEKPKEEEKFREFQTPPEWIEDRGIPFNNRPYLASMGIYMFKRESLKEMLTTDPIPNDFGKDVFPRYYTRKKIQAHLFDGYWEDVGTIKSYHEASLALASRNPAFSFHSPEGVIFTHMRYLPASRIDQAMLRECLISDGCVIESGTTIERSIVGIRVTIGHNATIRDTVLIGADILETQAQKAENRRKRRPDLGIGDNVVIEKAIIDKGCRIGHGVKIVNKKGIRDLETDMYWIKDGIVVIPRNVIIPDGTEI
jgi:glucose-1-phosphate adenylyltransferase